MDKIDKYFKISDDHLLFQELREDSGVKERPSWWNLMVKEAMKGNIYINIRHGNRIHIYHYGGRIAELYCSRDKKLMAKINKRYLDGSPNRYVSIEAKDLEQLYHKLIDGIEKFYHHREARMKDEEFLKGSYIDTEFGYHHQNGPLIEIDLVRCVHGILTLVELKHINDGRMLKSDDETPEIIGQMKSYQLFLNEKKEQILAYYQQVYDVMKSIGVPLSSTRPDTISDEVLLLVRYDTIVTNKNRMDRIKSILEKNNIKVEWSCQQLSYSQSQLAYLQSIISKIGINKEHLNGAVQVGKYSKSFPYILKKGYYQENIWDSSKAPDVYFKRNHITTHHMAGHLLSSQVSCLNHLFFIRKNRTVVLSVLNSIGRSRGYVFDDVVEVEHDDGESAYIAFEAVCDGDLINEGISKTRGEYCTSIDALAIGLMKGKRWLIPIEWKFTETYENESDYSMGTKGIERKRRYNDLITQSGSLNESFRNWMYIEPFYQLMRQTLWAEQMVAHKDTEHLKADDYLHIHVIPDENKELLSEYRFSTLNLEDTWNKCLTDEGRKHYLRTDNQVIIDTIMVNYPELGTYLNLRYGKGNK